MPNFVLPPPPPTVVPTASGDLFPVRRVFCVGRNYGDHAREMGSDPNREPPFFFAKPADAIVSHGRVPYPPATVNLHHEVELVAAIAQGGADIPVEAALAHVWGYTVGIDLTRRDLQDTAKKGGRPWTMAKGFDASGPVGVLRPVSDIGHPARGAITLDVNGQRRQTGDIGDMIWSVAEVVAYLSGLVTLAPGDLIFTGTPAGVGAVVPGDRLAARVEGVGELVVTID